MKFQFDITFCFSVESDSSEKCFESRLDSGGIGKEAQVDHVRFREDHVDLGAAELFDPVPQVGFLAENLDVVEVALVGRRERVVREYQLDLRQT